MSLDARRHAASVSEGLEWCVFLTLVVAGCSGGASDRSASERVDSLGTPRAERTCIPPPEGSWKLEEDLRLGTAAATGPEVEQFGRIASVVSDLEGKIYVLDGFTQKIRVFDSTGAYSHTVGRRGRGPGEFLAAHAMTLEPGGVLLVVDDGTARYSLFALDGTFLESDLRPITGRFPAVSGTFLHDGSYVDWGVGFPDGRFGARALFYPIVYYPTSGAHGFGRSDTLPPLEQRFTMLPGLQLPDHLFGDQLTAVIDQRGGIWFAHTGAYRIYRRGLEGDTTLVFSCPAVAAPLGEEDRAFVRREFGSVPSVMSARLRALPETKPVVLRLLTDNAEHVFVFLQLAGQPSGTVVVDVLQENGEYLARMILPVALAYSPRWPPVAYATPDHLYVLVKDSLDVQYVSRLKIIKGQTKPQTHN